MSTYLRIERMVITGLLPGRPALALRDEVERALSDLLSKQTVERIGSRGPAPLSPIFVGAPPPGRTVAMQVAMAIRDALAQPREMRR